MTKSIDKKTIGHIYERLVVLSQVNEAYDFVVKNQENTFLIYKKPDLEYLSSGDFNFIAIAKFENDQLILKIKLKPWVLVFSVLLYIFGICITMYLFFNEDYSFLFFFVVLIISILGYYFSRIKFKKHILQILRNL